MRSSAQIVLDRLKGYVSPDLDTTYGLHGLHPYPAKFIPQIPADIIAAHTNERHLVFDPFCGSGTTLAEAQRLGRRSIGSDSNPIATLIARAKTTPQSPQGIQALEALTEWAKSQAPNGHIVACAPPTHPSLGHWFEDRVTEELAYLLHRIREIEDPAARQLGECVFSSILVSVSNQESDTRYAAKIKPFKVGDVFRRFAVKIERVIALVPTSARSRANALTPAVYCADIRQLGADIIPDDTADLVVTSPPYANSYDYYLYHKWRMIWLGFDVKRTQNEEIGSRHEHSSKKAPIGDFEEKMGHALLNVSRILKPNKLAYFLVGDSIINGELIDSEKSLRTVAANSNLRFVESVAYPLDQISRSFREKVGADRGAAKERPGKQQRILVFESVRPKGSSGGSRKSAAPKATHSEVELLGVMAPGKRIAIRSSDQARHVHSLARYPSKFVPAIPAWAIDTFSPHQGLVMDPFAGSGTTSVEAIIRGRSAIAADVSPFSCLVSRAKTTRASECLIREEARRLEAVARKTDLLENSPRLRFDLDTFWFDPAHLEEFAKLKQFIDQEIHPGVRDFFLTSLAGTIRSFSYQDEAQIKVKRDGRKVVSGTRAPAELLASRLPRDVERLIAFNALASSDARSDVYLCSAERIDTVANGVDLVVTSPPYINAMNYPMTHRYENILLGLLRHDDKRDHEREYFGTERVAARNYKNLCVPPSEWSCADTLGSSLRKIYDQEPKRSYIAYKFFENMWLSVAAAKRALKSGGHMVMVIGRNRIRGVPIDTFEVIASFMADQGMEEVTRFEYQIFKNSLKLTRHSTADVIDYDGVAVFRKA